MKNLAKWGYWTAAFGVLSVAMCLFTASSPKALAGDDVNVGIVCWPTKDEKACNSGFCGFFTTCREYPLYDDYGYPNCCR